MSRRRPQNRAGREPAEDVKRRIVEAGRAAGFEKETARMLLGDEGRVIYVRLLRRPCGSAEVFGFVRTDGSFCGRVRVAATLRDEDERMVFHAVNMHGRESVPLERLGDEMRAVMREMSEVAAAREAGDNSPRTFGGVVWGRPIDTHRGVFGTGDGDV